MKTLVMPHPERKLLYFHLIGMLVLPLLAAWLFEDAHLTFRIFVGLMVHAFTWLMFFLNAWSTAYRYELREKRLEITHGFWGIRVRKRLELQDIEGVSRNVKPDEIDFALSVKSRFCIGYNNPDSSPVPLVRIRHRGGVFHTAMKLDPDQQDQVVEWLNAQIF